MLTAQRVEVSEDVSAVYEEMCERGWTDGLPVIPATAERVQAFIDYTGRDAGEIVAEIPPAFGVASIEKVAINAVMAGCRPEYMPVLLAAIEAVMEPDFNLNGIQCTTNPATPMIIVNGPIRDQLGINYKTNALGQGWRANATIGRALRLVLVNVGGAIPGPVDKATLGQPGKFGICLGENEEENFWEPLHVERGFSRDQSTVTVVGAAGTININAGTIGVDRLLTVMAHSITVMGTNDMLGSNGQPVLILCPSHAKTFADAGLSKSDVKRRLWELGRLPLDWFPPELVQRKRDDGVIIDGMVPLLRQPENLILMVAGGSGGLHTTFVNTFGGSTVAQTKVIKL